MCDGKQKGSSGEGRARAAGTGAADSPHSRQGWAGEGAAGACAGRGRQPYIRTRISVYMSRHARDAFADATLDPSRRSGVGRTG